MILKSKCNLMSMIALLSTIMPCKEGWERLRKGAT